MPRLITRASFIAFSLFAAVGCASTETSPHQDGIFVDSRDGRRYPVVRLGEQTWMARNLAFPVDPSWCYEDRAGDCDRNGRLYPWHSAVEACPDGWHLPGDEEWAELERYLGMADTVLFDERFRGTNQGARLREGGDAGFEAPISGYRRPDGSYARRGARSAYWLSTEADSAAAWHRDIRSGDGRIYRSAVPKGIGYKLSF